MQPAPQAPNPAANPASVRETPFAQLRRSPWAFALLALLALAGLHVVVGAVSGLSVDEAHYALYALHPALSYFDHPPLVGWVQLPFAWASVWLGQTFGAQGPWVDGLLLRIAPVAAWVLALLLLQQAARAMDLPKHARSWLWALALAAPLWHLIGFGLVPDTLLLPLAAALMGWLWLMRHPDVAAQWSAWLVLGALLGLAGLAKYTALLLVPGVVWVLVRAHGWAGTKALLCTPGPWLGVGLALALVSPVLVWNAQNDWASFAYQAAHGAGGAVWTVKAFAVALLAQALVYGPVLVVAVLAAWVGLQKLDAAQREIVGFCTALALPTLVVLLGLAGRGGSLPHWTSVAWLLLTPAAALALAGLGGVLKRAAQAVLGLQLLACVALLLAIGLGPGLPGKPNPFADFHGWRDAVVAAKKDAATLGQPLAVQNWTLASRTAWYAHPAPVTVLDVRQDQFDRWFGGPKQGQGAVLLNWSGMPFELPVRQPGATPAGTSGGFASCTTLGQQNTRRLGQTIARFEWFACTDWQGTAAPKRGTTLNTKGQL